MGGMGQGKSQKFLNQLTWSTQHNRKRRRKKDPVSTRKKARISSPNLSSDLHMHSMA